MKNIFERVVREHSHALASVVENSAEAVCAASDLIVETLRAGGTVFVCGNGGSAADAQHLAAEIVGRFVDKARPPLPGIALTTDSSALTALANDFGFEEVFARQLRGLAHAGDLLIALSTSGRSPNILRALAEARTLAVRTIALVGSDGSQAAIHADCVVRVPHAETARIQEMHQMIYHAWCEGVDAAFRKPNSG